MKLYEYMGKDLFKKYGIPVPRGRVAQSPVEAGQVAAEIGSVVIKSQILSGKRGKSGGIKFPAAAPEAESMARELLGAEINGLQVDTILVEEKLTIDRELYLAVTIDAIARQPVILASAEGGMDIEELPPEKIIKYPIDVASGVTSPIGGDICRLMGLTGTVADQFTTILICLYKTFVEADAELVEINPLVVSEERLIAADAKVTIDDDALFRHPEMPVVDERTLAERQAHEIGLAYVQLDGDIAVMANGAGITMATLDILQHYGGKPANFLDAGGGASVEQTAGALEILLSRNPSSIFINIFGGITRCDDVANAFAQVKKTKEIPVPVVIRLVGTNEEAGVRILQENGISAYKTMHEAAARVVQLAGNCQ